MLIDGLVEFLKDKLRNAVMSGLYSLFCFAMWLYLNDDGFQVAAILFAGLSAHQFYKYYLQRSKKSHSSDE